MPTDPTLLQTAAESIHAALEDAAADVGWAPARSCVTAGPPSIDCDSLFSWPSNITPVRDQSGKCPVVLRVTFQYVVGVCVGTNVNPNCQFWQQNAYKSHDRAWGVQAGFVQAGVTGNLCGVDCSQVRFGDFVLLTNDGGYSWWQGSVQIDLSPVELAS